MRGMIAISDCHVEFGLSRRLTCPSRRHDIQRELIGDIRSPGYLDSLGIFHGIMRNYRGSGTLGFGSFLPGYFVRYRGSGIFGVRVTSGFGFGVG
eukprot:4224711-Pyramimonas_sp.AAC.2